MKNTVSTDIRKLVVMTEQELKNLGLSEVGYVKPHRVKGQTAWVLHAADGTALAVQGNASAARQSALQQDIDIVALH